MTFDEILDEIIDQATNTHGAVPQCGRDVVAKYKSGSLPRDTEGLLFVIGYLVDAVAARERIIDAMDYASREIA